MAYLESLKHKYPRSVHEEMIVVDSIISTIPPLWNRCFASLCHCFGQE